MGDCKGGLQSSGWDFGWTGRCLSGHVVERRDWVIDAVTSVLVDGSVDHAHFRAGLGRLGFVCGAVVFVRPLSIRPAVHMGRDEGWRLASTSSEDVALAGMDFEWL